MAFLFLERVFKKLGLVYGNFVSTPFKSNPQLVKLTNISIEEKNPLPFHELVGSLTSLAATTRPNLNLICICCGYNKK